MENKLSYWLNEIARLAAMSTALLLPLFFWNLTTEFYETPKLLLLLVATSVLLILLAVKFIDMGKVTLTHTPIDIPLVLIGVTFIFSTFFTSSLYTSILGNLPRIHGGLVSYIVYVLFYFVLVSNLTTGQNEAKQAITARAIVNLLTFSAVVLAILSLLSYAGINVLGSLTLSQSANFSPAGSSFSLTSLLALLLPFPLISIFGKSQDSRNEVVEQLQKVGLVGKSFLPVEVMSKSLASLLLTLFVGDILLTGSLPVYLVSLLSLAGVLFVSQPNTIMKNAMYLILPVIVCLILGIGSFVPNLSSNNLLYRAANSFPRELQLPFPVSWKVSVSAFRDLPFWGSGPATYLFDFTSYKPIEYNNTQLWNVRFDQAFNEYLQFLATLGAPGLVALLLLTVVFVTLAIKTIIKPISNTESALAISALSFFILLALHPSTLMLWVTGVIIMAMFMITRRERSQHLQIGIASSKPYQNILNMASDLDLNFSTLSEILLIIFLLIIGATTYFGIRFVTADYYHRQALNAVVAGNGLLAYNQLVQAEQLNPYSDLYRTDLSQTNFALANAIAASKAPTDSSPAGSLTDQDKQNIQVLLSQAIAEGRTATTLSPNNPVNWEILGSIYRQISGVAQNALAFSLDSYGRAVVHDPLNPLLRLNVGGIYYSAKNYDLAIRFFTDSINLKPDFANGYYNLAVAYESKNDLQSAEASAEQVVALVDPKSPDYKVATDLLSSLKNKLSQSVANSSQQTPPAAQTNSALNNNSLPKVLNLPKSENIATPAAIKK